MYLHVVVLMNIDVIDSNALSDILLILLIIRSYILCDLNITAVYLHCNCILMYLLYSYLLYIIFNRITPAACNGYTFLATMQQYTYVHCCSRQTVVNSLYIYIHTFIDL